MKHLYIPILAITILSGLMMNAQVAINNDGSAPSDLKTMLEVKKPLYSKLKIRTTNYTADTSVLEFSNRSVTSGTDILLSHIREQGLFISSVSDLALNTRDSLMSMRTSGNVGIGIRNPVNTLHLHTPSSTINYLRFSNSLTGVGSTEGLIVGLSSSNAYLNNFENGPLYLGTNNISRLAIDASGRVGIGDLTPTYLLDVNGDANITGALRINGSAGTAGQVLTSNGTTDPEWKSAAYNNNTRFCFTMNENAAAINGTVNFNATRYNLNPTDIVRNPASITINKTGLYHFDLNMNIFIDYDAGAPYEPSIYLEFSVNSILYEIFQGTTIPDERNSADYRLNHIFSIDLHITAPTTITLPYSIYYAGAPVARQVLGQFTGYLISE